MPRAILATVTLATLGALASAGALVAWTEQALVVDGLEASPADTAIPASGARDLGLATYRERILGRNLFASESPPDPLELPVGSAEQGLQLLGTLVTEPASLSTALVQLEGDAGTHILGLGDRLGDHRVAAITPMAVHLEPFTDSPAR